MEQILQDAIHTAPLMGTILLSLLVILVNAFRKDSQDLQFAVTIAGILVNIALAMYSFQYRGTAFNGMILTGGYSSLFSIIFLVSAGLTVLLSREYIVKIGANFGEFYILVLIAVTGMMTFSSGLNLMVTFVGLEIMSVCLYILAGFTRKMLKSNEAALKYFLLGAFATGFFLYGIALIYGSAGTIDIREIAGKIDILSESRLFLVGTGLLLIGLAFKVGSVPFHMWVPDVYEGSPSMVSAFMSTGAKASAFAAMLLVFTAMFDFEYTRINLIIAGLAIASMIVGNVVAISQSNIKRMLAYSSIAHAGYMLIGIAAGGEASITATIYYLVSYTLTNIGAFGITSLIEDQKQENVDIESFRGLGFSHPLLGALMALFMFSLVGIPPLSGFFGKYYIFYSAIQQGFTWLTIVGVITSMVSVYYYFRIIVVMYFRAPETTSDVHAGPSSIISLVLSAVGILVIGLFPRLILQWMDRLF